MPDHVLISLASPRSPGALPDLLDWYRAVHHPEVLAAVPSLVEADLYRAAPSAANPAWQLPHQVLTVYRAASGAQPDRLLRELADATRARRFTFDGSLDPASARQGLFELL